MRFKLKSNDQIGLIFFVAFVVGTTLIYQFEERFNQEAWSDNPANRHKLVDDLLDRELLIGKSKTEVIELLGKPIRSGSTEHYIFLYDLGRAPSFSQSEPQQLQIIFKDETVFSAIITP